MTRPVQPEPPGGNGHPTQDGHSPPRTHGSPLGHPQRGAPATRLLRWMIGPLLAGVGAWLLWAAPVPAPPVDDAPDGPPRRFDPQPRRPLLTDPPLIAVGGFRRSCDDCHRLFQTPPEGRRDLMAHEHITLAHGMNDRCFNCHDHAQRELLVLRDGTTVGFAESARQCAQCHGGVFRDWQRGAHGKTIGSWRPDDERRRRLQCVECHDPHAPAYRPMEPLPAPDTLRMGDQSHTDHGPSRSPLRRARKTDSHDGHGGQTNDHVQESLGPDEESTP